MCRILLISFVLIVCSVVGEADPVTLSGGVINSESGIVTMTLAGEDFSFHYFGDFHLFAPLQNTIVSFSTLTLGQGNGYSGDGAFRFFHGNARITGGNSISGVLTAYADFFFTQPMFTVNFIGSGFVTTESDGRIQRFTVVATPEPTSLLLLTPGLVALWRRFTGKGSRR